MLQVLFLTALTVTIAVGGGTASVWYALDKGVGFGAVRSGPWVAHPDEGSPNADPWLAARRAQHASLPLGQGEGLAFEARSDSDGNVLTGGCVYELAGNVPASRLWTLHVQGQDGNARPRDSGLHSRQILRRSDSSFVVSVSSRAMPGNWVRVDGPGAFTLVLTLLDSPVTGTITAADQDYPRISRIACD